MAPALAKDLKKSYEGQILNNRYLVERLVSKGGMGTVYQGTHSLIGKKVAIKVLNSDLAFREDIVTRFYREAQAAAVIGHRNIVDVLDVGLINESQPYLVMEYLEGESLLKMLDREGTLNLSAACAIMEPLLQALSASHEKGVVHRDLKPDNIFIGLESQNDLVVKVIDFGISKFAHTIRDQRLTMAGAAVGTPPYMSPEQARGDDDVDFRSDLYSAGIIFYEMLVGKLPFEGVSVREVLAKVINDPPAPPESLNPNFPRAAGPIIEKALAKAPEDRYPNADAMLQDVRKLNGYNDRFLSLAAAAAGITQVSCAGVETPSSRYPVFPSVISPDPLSLFATQDASSLIPTRTKRFGRKSVRLLRGLLIGMGLAVLALIGILFGIGTDLTALPRYLFSGDATSGAAAPQTVAPEASDTVTISVTGVPRDASIYFDGARIGTPSFQTQLTEQPRPLRVELAGFEPFEIQLAPKKDTVVEVRLLPMASAYDTQSEANVDSDHDTTQKKHRKTVKPSKKRVDSQEKAHFVSKYGRHGATIADDFE